MTYHVSSFFATGETPQRLGRKHWNVAPYGVFETADSYVALGVVTAEMWKRFCAAVDREEWLEDERFETFYSRLDNREVLDDVVEQRLQSRPTDEWLDVLREHEIPCSPINSVADIVDDPHLEARGMLESVKHPDGGEFTLIDNPVNFSTLEAGIRTAPPTLGEHTEGVLERLGYDAEDIETLRERDII